MSVVDKRTPDEETFRAQIEARLVSRQVLKGGVIGSYAMPPGFAPATRDSLLDEMNRLAIDIEDAKAELLGIRKKIEAEREECEKISRERQNLDMEEVKDDFLYRQRIEEIHALTENARKESAELSAQLEVKAKKTQDKARKDGYDAGHADGYATGMAAAKESFSAEAEAKLSELSDLITGVSDYGPALMKKREEEIIGLVMAIAGKIVAKELKTKPDTIVGMLQEFVIRNQREAYINISVSPDMLPTRVRASEEVLEQIKALQKNIAVFVEKDAPEGTLVLETPKGVTDMSLPAQFDNIRETMTERENQD